MKMRYVEFFVAVALGMLLLMGCTTPEQAALEENTVCGVGEDCGQTAAVLSPAPEDEEKTMDVSVTDDGIIRIPLSEISNQLKKYSFLADGTEVTYFAVLGSDGEVRTAFDACDVCGGSMGYQQDGTDIFCRKCGRYFSIDGLGTQNKGYGCWPSYLPHTVEGDSIIIKKSDLEEGAHRFA